MSAKNIRKLLITGSTGLVGSRFVELYKNDFSITTIGRTNVDISVNLLSQQDIQTVVLNSDAEAIVNFAAYTKVDAAEKEKEDKNGEVYILNAMLPLWLAQACKPSGKKLFHISTDYVFDGKQKSKPYTEEDTPTPVNSWYSRTKYYGEENILKSSSNYTIIRISYPYSGIYERKLDIARAVVENLKNNQTYFGIKDQKIKPASVDDIAQALSFLLENSATGIYHLAGNYSPQKYITPYQFAQKIAHTLSLDPSLIKPISFLELSKKRTAFRPQHTWLDTKKIESLGLRITSIDKALKRFKNQMINK